MVIFTTFMPLAKVEMVVPAVVAPVVRLEEKVVLEESVEMAVHLSFTNAAVGKHPSGQEMVACQVVRATRLRQWGISM